MQAAHEHVYLYLNIYIYIFKKKKTNILDRRIVFNFKLRTVQCECAFRMPKHAASTDLIYGLLVHVLCVKTRVVRIAR
jgi:hypothetical protein